MNETKSNGQDERAMVQPHASWSLQLVNCSSQMGLDVDRIRKVVVAPLMRV